jgi:DNA-binding transcriptional MerR regulator
MMIDDTLFSIGELAKRSAVPVKTIRHYADEGVLPPSATSEAGYRMYTQDDARKLALIRSLRALGFSLDAIKAMLDGTRSPHDLATLQLDLVETQLHALGRQRAILRAAKEMQEPSDVTRQLEAAYAAASLGAAERSAKLSNWLDRATTVDPGDAGRAKIRGMVLDDLPDELSAEQLEAWIRLSTLLDDSGLLETLRLQHEPFAGNATATTFDNAAFGRDMQGIIGDATTLALDETTPRDERVQELVARWTALFAKALGREDDPGFATWFLAYAERTMDPRIEHFWKDVAVLRGWPPMPPFTLGQALLQEGLRAKAQP